MSNMEQMKALVRQRLTAAVEDVFGIIENMINVYEEKDCRSQWEIERQNSRLDMLLKPKLKIQRADPPQFSVCNDNGPPEQQERSPSLDQEDPEPLLIKEEQKETWTCQEREHFQWLQETDTKDSIFTVTCVRSLHDQHQSQLPHLHQTVENREGEPISSTSTMRQEAYGEGCGDSEPTGDCQPLSSDLSVAESGDTDRDEDMMESGGPQLGLKSNTAQIEKRQSSGISSKVKTSMESSLLRSASQDAATCKVCGKSFSYYASFMKHVRKHIKDAPCVCGVCGEQVESTDSLVNHLKSHNMALSKVVRLHTGEKPHGCIDCGKRFTSTSNLSMHMRIHTGSKPYSCSVCGKGFRHHHHVQYHMRTHTGEKPYSCNVCGKGFSRQNVVQVHMKTHTGERPYCCSVCGKGFITSSKLQNHLKTHTGERPYLCSICGKGFITSSDLLVHTKTHTGERPYSCSVCGKGFITSADLQRHMKNHTGERPYTCSVCGEGFIRRDRVQDHMKSHTVERP